SLLFTLQGVKTLEVMLLTALFPLLASNIIALPAFIILLSLGEGWSAHLLYAVIPRLTSQEKLVKVNIVFSFSTQIVQAAVESFPSVVVLFIGATSTL
ncbi:MFS transporter, partial [Bacillus pseudomycoides]|nr:MFS transporter [Bacillus pseudomycoides]